VPRPDPGADVAPAVRVRKRIDVRADDRRLYRYRILLRDFSRRYARVVYLARSYQRSARVLWGPRTLRRLFRTGSCSDSRSGS